MASRVRPFLEHTRQIADLHGGYPELAAHAMFLYSYRPLFTAAGLAKRTRRQSVVFITGTQGKTTTLRAVRHLLNLPLDNWNDSNSNVRGQVAWTVLRERDASAVVPVEAADGIGMMDVYARALRPRVSTVLQVGAEHLAGLGSLTAATDEMAPAVEVLPPDGWAVLNRDDPHVASMASRTEARVLWFGRHPAAQVRITTVATTADRRLVVSLDVQGSPFRVATQLVGEHYAQVVAAAVATGLALGLPPSYTAPRLGTLPVTPRRLEPLPVEPGAMILSDDFKTTPETIYAGLAELARWPANRRWVVITVGAPWLDHVVAWNGLDVPTHSVVTVAEATALLQEELREGDVVYLKGDEDFRLRRIALALQGRQVTCNRIECRRRHLLCDHCPDLGR